MPRSDGGGCADDLVQLGDEPLVLRQQSLARGRERQGTRRSNEQLRAHLVFETSDALRDDGRRHPQLARRSRETPGARDQQKGLDIEQCVHGCVATALSMSKASIDLTGGQCFLPHSRHILHAAILV